MPAATSPRRRPDCRQLFAVAVCAVIALMFLASGSAHGQAASTPTGKGEQTPLSTTVRDAASGSNTPSDGGSGGGGIVRTIVGLAVVIAVIYGVTWVLRQLKSRDEDEALGGGLQTAATLPLGPGRAVHLVRAGNEFLLLGVTEGGVQPLRAYSEDEARAAGFPIDELDELEPLKSAPGGGSGLVERIREMTVRR